MIRRLKRARCEWFGHRWSRWSDWASYGFTEVVHQRSCTRCPAVEVQCDGKPGVIHD